jgi:radical SAM superfamily enzyme with C-terminal helix-hairpin-helix motif
LVDFATGRARRSLVNPALLLISYCDLSMRIRILMKASFALLACTLPLLVGCYDSNNTQALQRHTADATAAAKRSAGAVARGVVEGLTRKGPVDINKGSEKDLAQLPGLTQVQARAIIAGRPYVNTSQLVKRRILTKAQYEKIRAQIGVN